MEEFLITAEALFWLNTAVVMGVGMFVFGVRGLQLVRLRDESRHDNRARVAGIIALLLVIAVGMTASLFGVFELLVVQWNLWWGPPIALGGIPDPNAMLERIKII